MTAEEIRDLGYLSWRDPMAWMERMKGKRWDNMVEKEKQHYNDLLSQPNIQKEARQMEKEIKGAKQYMDYLSFKIGCGTVEIQIDPLGQYLWKWIWQKKHSIAEDIDVQGNIIWYINPRKDRPYEKTLLCEDSRGRQIWSKPGVSSQVAVVGELCYFVKVVDYFNTIEIRVCNAQTGNEERVLFREPDESRDLYLIKESNKTLYFKSEDVTDAKLFKIDGLSIKQLATPYALQFALGESIYGEDCLLLRNTRFQPWIQRGNPVKDWIFPEEEAEWINIQSGLVITMNEGAQTIWYCSSHKKPKVIFKVKVGSIEPNPWTKWENMMLQTFFVKTPFAIPFTINIINNKVYRMEQTHEISYPISFEPLEVHRFHATSKDGTKVPYVIVKEKGVTPKAQLIYVYGAYGSSTPVSWPYYTWYPLLKRKWAIVFAMVRGGGDMDAAWAEIARRNNRHVAVDDYEAVIRDALKKNNLTPEKTVLYGRSAGGLPVGAIISHYPDGQLVGAAFTEVPYVDVLRTSSNPELPLTIGEYEEFGNPLKRVQNFRELMLVSPINTLPEDGAPGVFVLTHVGLQDRQVYAYESFKWIQRLRGYRVFHENNLNHPKGKYITMEKKEAHQYRPTKLPRFRANDFAILDAWVDGNLKW